MDQPEHSAPSAHECLKPLEALSLLIGEGGKGSWLFDALGIQRTQINTLLIDEGGKGSWFGHQREEKASVLALGASWVWWKGST